MSQFILLPKKPVLDNVSCVNRGFVVLEDTITIGEQSLYNGMDLTGQNAHTILGRIVALQSNHGAYGKPRYGCPNRLRTPAMFHV
ncbi:hypothetical protein AVEN_195409-1 [Araneus ventricosus]|uniref:Uncharacterized protein n=1 Tax=Araneus ventricosus TaxID=182803 RepID=A0A4Y2RWP8_ARAVE|nr:hypothetical protein AVEN_195409-1 [Araneus ventricosus]